jgi:hypothetical protein
MADLVHHRVAVIAHARQFGLAAQLADQFIPTPLETHAMMRDNEFVVA